MIRLLSWLVSKYLMFLCEKNFSSQSRRNEREMKSKMNEFNEVRVYNFCKLSAERRIQNSSELFPKLCNFEQKSYNYDTIRKISEHNEKWKVLVEVVLSTNKKCMKFVVILTSPVFTLPDDRCIREIYFHR